MDNLSYMSEYKFEYYGRAFKSMMEIANTPQSYFWTNEKDDVIKYLRLFSKFISIDNLYGERTPIFRMLNTDNITRQNQFCYIRNMLFGTLLEIINYAIMPDTFEISTDKITIICNKYENYRNLKEDGYDLMTKSVMAFSDIMLRLELNPKGFKRCSTEGCYKILYVCKLGNYSINPNIKRCCKTCIEKLKNKKQ